MSRQVKNIYEFGPFCLNPAEHTLLRDGRPIPIRPKMFDILLVLIENHGHLVDKERLMSSVWTEQFVEEGNLNKNISMLRRVLGEGDNGQKFIETVPKRGFRFVAEVRQLNDFDENDLVANAPTPVHDVSVEDDSRGFQETPDAASELQARQIGTRSFGRNWVGVVVIAVLLLAVVVYVTSIRKSRTSATPTITSIVVLPLQNLSGDPTQEYFVDGMTDALIGDLAQIGALRVISRTSAMHYKGTNKSLPEIARELNVDAVVEGTVQRAGDRVHVRAQLIHAATDSHLWASDYDRDSRDVLDLQAEVAGAIASEVRIKITPAERKLLVPKRVVARDAIDNYLQGRYFWNQRTEHDLHQAIVYFENAIKADPNYAQAYAGLADSYNQLGTTMIGGLPSLEARRTAEIAARKALEIDNEVAEAHAALGYVNFFNWNWTTADAEFKRALDLNPNYASAHSQYALYLVAQGRIDEALAEVNRAQELDPLSLTTSMTRGFILENGRRYEESIEQLRRVIASDPNHYGAHWFLALTYIANHQFDEAIAASEKAVALSGRAPAALGVLGLSYGVAGRKREANNVLNELLQLQKQRYITQMAPCYVYIGLGDKDQAFVWLEKAYQERSNPLALFKVSPTVDSLRSDPRFADLLRRIGLDSDSQYPK
jgi:TolB-like protein/DNA-binding winged helix-turn-helix (wHTH) protein/Tfp pilus assembly protein PilF